jgi:hypothetical protein
MIAIYGATAESIHRRRIMNDYLSYAKFFSFGTGEKGGKLLVSVPI